MNRGPNVNQVQNTSLVEADPWQQLRQYTQARIALGRVGSSLPTEEILNFGLAHAMARDAVHIPLDVEAFCNHLNESGFKSLAVESAAENRHTYLLRPDLGRRLSEKSANELVGFAHAGVDFDVVFLVGDGLSSLAIKNHALPLLKALQSEMPSTWRVAPIIVAKQARVALSDEVGSLLHAKLVIMLVGERPGLSSPDSLGMYLTYNPKVGVQDAERNCISNVRSEGLHYQAAAVKAIWLAREAMRLRKSGVALKDNSDVSIVEISQHSEQVPLC